MAVRHIRQLGDPILRVRCERVQNPKSAATRHGARAVLLAHEQDLVTVTVDDPAVIDDLNTPADYERLVREVNRDIY